MLHCGLLGEKLGHSYSPQIHAELGDYEYLLYEKAPDEVEDFEAIGKWIEGAKRYFLQCFTDRDTVPFGGLSAPSKEKLEACAAAVSGYVTDVQIRGVD